MKLDKAIIKKKQNPKPGENPYYRSYYRPKYKGLPKMVQEKKKRANRAKRFDKAYQHITYKGLSGLDLILYLMKRNYPYSRIGEIFGFTRSYAHQKVKDFKPYLKEDQ